MSERDCIHGQLARSCGLCERDATIAALQAEVARYKSGLADAVQWIEAYTATEPKQYKPLHIIMDDVRDLLEPPSGETSAPIPAALQKRIDDYERADTSQQPYEKGWQDGRNDAWQAYQAEVERYKTARPLSEYHEDMGDVLWWSFPILEAPYVGIPHAMDWPGDIYCTHWTQLLIPPVPSEIAEATKEELNRKIDQLAKKRDHAADVLGKPLLGLTYQMEIDKLRKRYVQEQKP